MAPGGFERLRGREVWENASGVCTRRGCVGLGREGRGGIARIGIGMVMGWRWIGDGDVRRAAGVGGAQPRGGLVMRWIVRVDYFKDVSRND